MQPNNRFRKNRFKKRINRFSHPTFVNEVYVGFDFNNNLKSNRIEELKFTNFVSSNRCKKYCELEKICIKIYKNKEEWCKLFVADEIEISREIPKMDRVYNIIGKINDKSIHNDELILKFKNLKDPELQFYVKNERWGAKIVFN